MLLAGCPATTVPTPRLIMRPDGTLDPDARDLRRDAVLRALGSVDKRATQLVEDGHFPGVAIGIVLDNQLIWTGGYGVRDVSDRSLVSQETVFRIASVTKTMTALVLLGLRDAGKLRLDDPVSRYVPEVLKSVPRTKDAPEITLRHLMTHTSGLPRVGGVDYSSRADKDLSQAEVIAALDGLKHDTTTGTNVEYSNLAMGLLTLVISRVSAQPFRQVMQQLLFTPLGMASTVWARDEVPPQRLATGYAKGKDGAWTPRHHWRLGAIEGAGGAYSSVSDMARYIALQMHAWPPRDGSEDAPFTRATIRETHRIGGWSRPGQGLFGAAWGLGVLEGDLMLVHTGGTWQYASIVRVLPERGLGIVALGNSNKSNELVTFTRHAITTCRQALVDAGLSR